MNGGEASASDARLTSKSSHEEEEGSNHAEEEEGLVALVKKRRSDVKQLVNRIATLEDELSGARKKLAKAETLLQEMQGQEMQGPVKDGKRKKKEPAHSASRHQNDQSEVKSAGPSPGPTLRSSDAKVLAPNGSRPGSAPTSLLHNKNSSNWDTSDVNELPTRLKMDSAGGRKPLKADRRDRKAFEKNSGGETSEKVAIAPSPQQQQQHVNLIMTIKSTLKAQPVSIFNPSYSPCKHRRKMRSLVLNPSSDSQCATSALDGVINFWQIHVKSLDINFRYSIDCLSPGQRHWPEDLVWHPDGHSLFAVYTADNEDAQVAVIQNDNKKKTVTFLPDKPHIKGIINGITFMPWSSSLFVTGGSDHMVHMWREKEGQDAWEPKLLHGNLHTSAVHGVAGTRHKELVLSAGSDKRVIGYDPAASRLTFKHDLESKAMTVLPNTVDFNLFMVQTGQPSKQLHLFDIRTKSELHTFGWQQETSDTQSSLITQSWSPDGYYTASGSADPKIVLFDIRFNGREPAQTIYAHTKRVFMAVWHQTLPLMLSISSDLNIGLHRTTGK